MRGTLSLPFGRPVPLIHPLLPPVVSETVYRLSPPFPSPPDRHTSTGLTGVPGTSNLRLGWTGVGGVPERGHVVCEWVT